MEGAEERAEQITWPLLKFVNHHHQRSAGISSSRGD